MPKKEKQKRCSSAELIRQYHQRIKIEQKRAICTVAGFVGLLMMLGGFATNNPFVAFAGIIVLNTAITVRLRFLRSK